MKKIFVLLILCSAIMVFAENNLLQTTLKNGMQIVVKENVLNESVGFYCFVKTGSVSEGKYLGGGISHFLEHIVSSGTTSYHTEEEYNQMGKEMGALVNAYTTQTATVFYITVDKAYKDLALQNLSQQMQFNICAEKEVNREREVILKEIVLRSTPPSSRIYQRYQELVYPNSNKRYPVIGYTDIYKTITREQLQDYYKTRYSPNNMIFVAVGDFEAEAMLAEIAVSFEDFPRRQIEPVVQPVQHKREGNLEYIEEFEIETPKVYISTILPAADYVNTTALNAALSILFSKRQSPIRYKLVEELQLVNKERFYAYAYEEPNSPEGEIVIRFNPKRSADIDKIISIINTELENYSKSGFTRSELQNYINRLKAQELLSTPGVSDDANRIGWTMMSYNIPDRFPLEIARLEALSPEDLSEQIKKHFGPKNRVIFKAVPVGEKELLEQKANKPSERSEISKTMITDKLTLLHKRNRTKPLIKGVIYFPVSTNYETEETAGTLSFMFDLMFKGSKKFNSLYISEWLEDHIVSLNSRSSDKGTFIEFKCLKADYPKLQEILLDAFNNPNFEENEIKLAKAEYEADHNNYKSRATSAHRDHIRSVLYKDMRDRLSMEQRKDIILAIDKTELLNLYENYFNAETMIITLFGDLTEAEATTIAKNIRKNVPTEEIEQAMNFTTIKGQDDSFVNKYRFEQVNLDIFTSAPSQNSEDFKAMRLINMILSGARGRLHLAVRGNNNLAYFAFPEYWYSADSGYFNLNSQTSIDKKDELIAVMKNELQKLKDEIVPEEEINSAIEENKKMYNAMLNDNSLPYYITYYEAIGLGYDYFDKIIEFYEDTTPTQIRKAANKYFSKITIIISEPDSSVKLMVD
ncbi:MAG: insulinase family protein [Candidatus Cloacimonetes bacterium]|nr:insulinase family protein [Candidatus Cloacimonadota bacterium]